MKPSKVLEGKTEPDAEEPTNGRSRVTYTPEEREQRKALLIELSEQKKALSSLKRAGREQVAEQKKAASQAARTLRDTTKHLKADTNALLRTVAQLELKVDQVRLAAAKRLGM